MWEDDNCALKSTEIRAIVIFLYIYSEDLLCALKWPWRILRTAGNQGFGG